MVRLLWVFPESGGAKPPWPRLPHRLLRKASRETSQKPGLKNRHFCAEFRKSSASLWQQINNGRSTQRFRPWFAHGWRGNPSDDENLPGIALISVD
jgi:hypothetical protein